MAWEPVDPQSDAPPGLGFDPRKTRATDIDPYIYPGEPVPKPRMDIPAVTPLPGLAIEPTQRKPGAMVGLAMRVNDLLGRPQPAEYAPYQPLPPAAPVVTPQEPQPVNWQPVRLDTDVGKAALHYPLHATRAAVEGVGDMARGFGQASGAIGRDIERSFPDRGPLYAPPTGGGYSTSDIAAVAQRPSPVAEAYGVATAPDGKGVIEKTGDVLNIVPPQYPIAKFYEMVGTHLDKVGDAMKQWAGKTLPDRQVSSLDAVHDWRSALVYGMESSAQAAGSSLPTLATYMAAGPFAAAIPTYAQSIGQMRSSMEEAGFNPKEQDAIILAGGAIMGRIEMMSHGALSSLFKEQLGQHVVRRMMSAGVRGGATEGMEEILQEATQIAGEAIAKGENVGLELLSDKGLARMKEAGVGAFVGGFGLGAGGTGGRYAGRALADQYRAWGEARDRTAAGDTTLSPTDLGHVSIFPERQGDGKSEPLAAITVYHGTPHHFGRFDSSKIGTGERAQAFGHGLYFAEEKGVAEGYRDRLAPKPDVDFSSASSIASEALRVYGDRQKAVESFKSDLAQWPDHPRAQLYRGAIAALEDGINPRQSFGAVYTVAINAEPHQFLDWDAPWSQQPPQVLEAFAKLGMPKSITEPTMDGREPTGATVYGRLEQALEDRMLANHAEANKGVYPPPPTDYGPDMARAASEALRSVGIKGARYFDQMSRGNGDGTRNYVVYDDSILDITHKNGKPVDAKTRDAIASEVAPLSAVSSKVDDARARAEKFKRWKENKEIEDLMKPKTTAEVIKSRLGEGKPVDLPIAAVHAVNDVIRPMLELIPEDAHAGVISRIEPVDPVMSKSGITVDTKVTFTSPNGGTFSALMTREMALNSGAIFLSSGPGIGFVPLELFDKLSETSRGRGYIGGIDDDVRKKLTGTFLHEATHLLSRSGVMSFGDWRRLVDHSNFLGVLDFSLRKYLQTIGAEEYNTVPADKTIRQAYEAHYRGYSDIDEAIDQEAAAIMVQLASHGVIDKVLMDPVADLFDRYFPTMTGGGVSPMPAGASASSLEPPSDMLAAIAQEPRSPFGRVRSLFNRFRGGQDGRQNDGPDAPGPSSASRDATAGGPGARAADIAGGDSGPAGQRHGDQAQFRLNGGYRGHVVQIVDARTGQPRREYYVYGQKGSPASGDYSPTTSLRVMKGTPNWLSRATLIQRKDGEWEVSGIAVRRGARRRGIATNLLDAIDESLGSKVRPAEHLRRQEHEFWKRRDPIAVSDYVRFDGDFYTPERLYGLHQSFVHIAATGSKLARAQAGNAVRRIEHALKKTLPESVVPRGDDFLLAIGRHEEEWEESWWQSLADRDARIEARRMPDQMPARQRFDRSALEVAADRLLREIRQSETEMRAAGLGAEEIARGLSDLFGVGVDADQISQGDTWWSVPKSPEYTEMPAPATTGAAPVLRRADVAERVISAEHSGLGDGEVAARMSEEFGRPIPETLIADIRKEHAPVRGRHIKARTIAALTTLYRQGVPHKDAAKQISDMLGTPVREKWVRDTVHRQGIVKSSADEATRRAGTARTPERLAELVDVLRQGKTYDDAAAELSKRWGVPVSRAWVNISVTRHKLAAQITPSADRRGVARTPERMAELSGLLQQGMTSSEAAAELSRRWGRQVNGTWVTNSIAKHGLRHQADPTPQVVEQPLFAISGRDTGYARFEEITRPVYDRSAPVKDSIEKVRLILRDEFGFHDAIINPRGGLDRAEKAIHAYRIISDITGMPKSSIGYRAQVRFGGDKPAIGSASSWNPINALGGFHLGYFKWLPQSTWLGRAKQYVRGKSATTGFGPWSQEVVDMPSAGGVAVHEWAHLFDTHAGQQRSPLRHMAFGGPRSMATAQLFFRKMINPVYLAAKAVPEPFKSFLKMLGDMRAWDARRTFPWMRPEMARAWEDLIGALREGERSWLDVTRAPIGSLKERIFGDAPLDRAKRSGRYISRPWEQFARAFEIYIAQKAVGKYGYEAVEIVGSPEFRGPEYMRVKDPSFSRMMDAFDRIFANLKADDVTSQPLFAISGRTPTSRSSLVNVLRGFGGIQDVTGDLRAILDRPGTKGYIPGIINKNGLHPDMARERLVEMGYILDDGSLGGEATSTVDDLYDLVRRLANGERVYPRTAEGETERAADEAVLREDENLFAVERALADLDDYIEKSGLSPLTASERDSAAALIQHNPTPDEMDDLIERLYNETYQAEIEKAYANLTTNEARIAVALQSEGFDRDDAIEQARQIEENGLAAEDIARQKDRGARQDAAGEEPGAGTFGAAGQIAASVGGAGAQGQLNLGSRQTAPGTGGAPPLPGSVPPPLPPGGGRMGPPPLPPSPPPPGGGGPRGPHQPQGPAGLPPSGFGHYARQAINKIHGWYSPIDRLKDADKYRLIKYRALGTIDASARATRKIWEIFRDASAADKREAYAYLTTRGMGSGAISDPKVRQAADISKQIINALGVALVHRGMIPQSSFDKYRDRYLPRVYLKHLIDRHGAIGGFAGGARPSKLGYTKRRRDIDKETRLLLGEITDPGFLASRSIFRVIRDMALMDALDDIAQNGDWVFRDTLVPYRGRMASAFYLKAEAEDLSYRALFEQDAVSRQRMEAEATALRQAAAPFIRPDENVPDGYAQVPDSPRYGMLRGMYVRSEIKNDLLPSVGVLPDDMSAVEKFFSPQGAGGKMTGWWKAMKVPMNPSTQVRNVISNGIMLNMSGMSWPSIVTYLGKSVREIASNGPVYRQALNLGLKSGGFSEQELSKITAEFLDAERVHARQSWAFPVIYPALIAKQAFATATGKAGDAYQYFEGMMKLAKMMHGIEKEGKSPDDAYLDAQKWLFDYSEVPRSVRFLRNFVFGAPFITYQYKALPRIIETAAYRPWKLAPYIALPYMFSHLLASLMGVDKDDVDKLKATLPDFLRQKENMLILPWKDSHGRWQYYDFGYLLPWSMYQEAASQSARGEIGDALRTTGLISGPLIDLVSVFKSGGVDPFTRRPIYDKRDPPQQQFVDILNYVNRTMMPPWLTDQSFAIKMLDAYNDAPTKSGDPGLTMGQAALRAAGQNVYPIEPDVSRARNLNRMEYEIRDLRARMRQRLRDKRLTDEQRDKIVAQFNDLIQKKRKEKEDYAARSEVHPKLRTGGGDASNWQPVTMPAPQWQPVAPQSPPSNWQPVVPP